MKCPLCGAWSTIDETRAAPYNTNRRRRHCANGHKFTTLEVLPAVISRRDLRSNAQFQAQRQKKWRRDEEIRKDTRPSTQIAKSYGVSDTRVRQIRAGGSSVKPRKKP